MRDQLQRGRARIGIARLQERFDSGQDRRPDVEQGIRGDQMGQALIDQRLRQRCGGLDGLEPRQAARRGRPNAAITVLEALDERRDRTTRAHLPE